MIGVPGALVLAWITLYGARQAYTKRNGYALIVLLFFIVTGITEDFAFPNRPGWQTLIFFATVLSVCRQRQGRQSKQPDSRRPAPGPNTVKDEGRPATPNSLTKA